LFGEGHFPQHVLLLALFVCEKGEEVFCVLAGDAVLGKEFSSFPEGVAVPASHYMISLKLNIQTIITDSFTQNKKR
jgi:hypothetical protein